jgi:hypothetical protein
MHCLSSCLQEHPPEHEVSIQHFGHCVCLHNKGYILVLDTHTPMLSGSTVTTAWRVLGLQIEEMASRYGG